jgi:hypothetical protein
MKVLYILLFVFNIAYSQDSLKLDTIKYNLSNSLGGNYASNTKQLNITFSGINSLTYKKYNLTNTASYSGSWTSSKIAEEFSDRTNITRDKFFILYTFTHSLTRKIDYDNSIGIGYVHWWKYFSLSYGTIYEKTNYSILPSVYTYRHSIRTKISYKNLLLEYYYQPNIIDMKDIILTGTTKLTLFQKKIINIAVTDVINYRSTSLIKMIHTTTLGITFNLKN